MKGKASTIKTTFSRATQISIDIQADAPKIWGILTNAKTFSTWNSTIISLDGEIELGKKIQLKSTLDPNRTFNLKVKSMTPNQEMIWADGMAPFFKGERTYTLQSSKDGSTTFSMKEKLSGLTFPMAAKHIPPFDESFEIFAADLKKEAEKVRLFVKNL